MTKRKNVKIDEIVVEDRYREDIGNLDGLIESIKEYGFISTIVVDDSLRLIAGFRRMKAAEEAGLKSIPAIVISGADQQATLEMELLENVERKDFTWIERANLEKAIVDLKKSEDPNWTIRKQAAFMGHSVGGTHRRLKLAEVLEEIPELADSRNEDEAWKRWKRLEEDAIVSAMRHTNEDYKDIIRDAEDSYRIGDAYKGLKNEQSSFFDFIEVDPPYGIDLKKVKGRNADVRKVDLYNEISVQDYPDFIQKFAEQTYRVLKDDSFCIWWFGPVWYTGVKETLEAAGFKVNPIPAIWVKTNFQGQTASPNTALASCYEPFFVLRKGEPKLAKPGRRNTFIHDPTLPQDKIHPTERPLSLMTELIETFVFPGSTICVPFLGSGVTLRAAFMQHSKGYGWDLEEMCKPRFLNAVYKDEEDTRAERVVKDAL
jgi:ParB family chromosome partitioning protein